MPRAKASETKKSSKKPDGGVTKQKKVGKDPNVPKRPLSAFFLWMAVNRKSFQKEGVPASISFFLAINNIGYGFLKMAFIYFFLTCRKPQNIKKIP